MKLAIMKVCISIDTIDQQWFVVALIFMLTLEVPENLLPYICYNYKKGSIDPSGTSCVKHCLLDVIVREP